MTKAKTEQVSAFAAAAAFVLAPMIEGGYVNDPRDPGGETNFGISRRAYPDLDIKALTKEEALEIYKRDYWDAVRADDLPPAIALAVFDAAVNQGRSPAIQLLQRAVGTAVDGVLGPITLAEVQGADQHLLLIEYLGWRARRYHGTHHADTYIRGWMNRLFYLQAYALQTLLPAPQVAA